MARADVLESVVVPVVESAGLDLVDIEQKPGRLKVTVDRKGGVDLDAISLVTGRLSHALDQEDAVPGGHYELEVSSPGVERPLRRPEQFLQSLGEQISVRTRAGIEGERRVHGTLVSAGEHEFAIEGSEVPEGRRTFRYEDVDRAHTVFDWRGALAGKSAPSGRREHKRERAERRIARDDEGERVSR